MTTESEGMPGVVLADYEWAPTECKDYGR